MQGPGSSSEPWELCKVDDSLWQGSNIPEQRQPVLAHSIVLAHDENLVKVGCCGRNKALRHLHSKMKPL